MLARVKTTSLRLYVGDFLRVQRSMAIGVVGHAILKEMNLLGVDGRNFARGRPRGLLLSIIIVICCILERGSAARVDSSVYRPRYT